MAQKPEIYIFEDRPTIRTLYQILVSREGYPVGGLAGSFREGVELATRIDPDAQRRRIALVDGNLGSNRADREMREVQELSHTMGYDVRALSDGDIIAAILALRRVKSIGISADNGFQVPALFEAVLTKPVENQHILRAISNVFWR